VRRHLLLVIALAAVAHSLLYVPFVEHVTGDGPTYLAAARALREGGYSTPLRAAAAPATGFSAHPGKTVDLTDHVLPPAVLDAPERQVWRAPVYPTLLALVGGAERPGPSRNALYVVQALLIGAAALLVGGVAGRLWGRNVGLLAAALVAVDPFSKRYAGLVLSEALAMALAALCAYALVRAWPSPRLRWWALAGLAGGLLTLTRPGLAPAVLIVIGAAAVRAGTVAKRAARAAAVLAPCVAVVAPWLAWTAVVTGTPTLQAYGSGVNLLVGAHGQGRGTSIFMVAQSPEFRRDLDEATAGFASEQALARDPDAHGAYLVDVDRSLRERAVSAYRSRMRDDPDGVLFDYGWRLAFLWMAHTDWYQPSGGPLLAALRLVDWLVLLTVAVGIVAAAAGRVAPARVLGVMLLATTLILATAEAEARFTIPLRPLAFALAALALAQLLRAAARLRVARDPRAPSGVA
jgi:4-amino-4-deoxy-L-arabinose transferase-like glycosyltransferase